MKNLFLLAAIVLAAAAVLAALAKRYRPRAADLSRPWPLEAQKPLLSESEQVVYRRLVKRLPEYSVATQVQLLQMLRFRRGYRSRAIHNRISQLSVDFVVLRPDTSIVAAIELDDATHGRPDRREADLRKAHALASAGVPLLRWQSKAIPDEETMREEILAAAKATPRIAQ